jgi:hypothetical protein
LNDAHRLQGHEQGAPLLRKKGIKGAVKSGTYEYANQFR